MAQDRHMAQAKKTDPDPLARLVGRDVVVELPKLEQAYGRLVEVGEFLILEPPDGRTVAVPRRRVEVVRCWSDTERTNIT